MRTTATLLTGSRLILAIVSGVVLAQPPPVDHAAIDALVERYRQTNHVPGMAIALTQGDRVLYVRGYGHDSMGVDMAATTVMPIASLSKSFTSLAMMQLVEAGRVGLDAPVRQYLKDFRVADPRSDRITVRDVLAHTSGLSDLTFPEKSGPRPHSLAEGVALLRTARLVSDPGTTAHYHNPNYWIAARLVEVVSGMSFGEYLRTHIFVPVGMNTTTTVSVLDGAPGVARGHVRVFGVAVTRPEPDWFLGGASGIVTTAVDLAQWLIVQNNGGVAASGIRLISPAGLQTMHAGLGWSTRGDGDARTVEHSGWQFTFTAHQILVPRTGDGIAVMSNVGLGLAPADSDALAHLLVSAMQGGAPSVGPPIGAIVDFSCLALALFLTWRAARGLGRAQAWAAVRVSRSKLRLLSSFVPWLVPPLLLFGMRAILSFVFGGRDASITQMLYVVPVLLGCLAVLSCFSLALMAARTVHLWRAR